MKFSQLIPLVCSCQVTVVSVASPTSSASQKSVALPVNVALGQQILTVQQSTSVSPVKVATSQSTTQVTWKHRTVSCSWCHLIWGGKGIKKKKSIHLVYVHKCHFSSVWESRSCCILLYCAVMLFSSLFLLFSFLLLSATHFTATHKQATFRIELTGSRWSGRQLTATASAVKKNRTKNPQTSK